jgi:hypothetical protein
VVIATPCRRGVPLFARFEMFHRSVSRLEAGISKEHTRYLIIVKHYIEPAPRGCRDEPCLCVYVPSYLRTRILVCRIAT